MSQIEANYYIFGLIAALSILVAIAFVIMLLNEKTKTKGHRALGIIIKKNVNMKFLSRCKNLKEYNNAAKENLTQKEFDLLKEATKWKN